MVQNRMRTGTVTPLETIFIKLELKLVLYTHVHFDLPFIAAAAIVCRCVTAQTHPMGRSELRAIPVYLTQETLINEMNSLWVSFRWVRNEGKAHNPMIKVRAHPNYFFKPKH